MFEDPDYNSVTFTHREHVNGVNVYVERRLDNKLTYRELAEEFVNFLQNMGFTYIGGLVVLDQDGNEIYQTI